MRMRIRHLALSLLLISGGSAQGGDTVTPGRLFFTPEQRAARDRQQDIGAAEKPDSLTVDGEIWRNTQRRTRWINGKTDGVEGRQTPSIPVGDTLHHGTRGRESLLGDGRLIIKRK
jgi:hypothetical protein